MEKGRDSKKIINIDLDDDENDNNASSIADPDSGIGGCADTNTDDIDASHCNAENTNHQTENATSNSSNKKNRKITRALKDILTSNNTKFMSNFDPELSNREKRKLTRKFNAEGKKIGSVHDEIGGLNGLEKDVCDCLVENCPGCHFPCPKCRSCKCGAECRVNRKWTYEAVENEADLIIIKNSSIVTS